MTYDDIIFWSSRPQKVAYIGTKAAKDLAILPKFAKVWSTWTFWDLKVGKTIHFAKVLVDEFDEVSRGWVLVITLAGVTNLGDRF